MKWHKFTATTLFAGAFASAISATAMAQDAAGNYGAAAPQPMVGTAPQPQVPQPPDQSGVNWKGVGVGAGTVLGNAVYMPAKLVYGILGGIAGGAGWALTGGNSQVANTIWRSSLGGDYVLTPNMVAGKSPVHFSGPTTTAPPPVDSSTATPANDATVTASSNPGGAAPPMIANPTGPRPIDSGAGPVGAGAPNRAPKGTAGGLPDTNIE